MVILGHTLSSNAVEFIKHYEKKLDRKWRFDRLPYDHPSLGDLIYDENFYVISLKKNIPGEAFDAVFCHEIFHAFQISRGYPTVISNKEDAADVKEYSHRLSCAILDLSADTAVRKHDIDDSYIVQQRFKQIKELSRGNFSRCSKPFGKQMLVIDLIIDLHGVVAAQKDIVLQGLKKALPGVYETYTVFMEKIDQYGYSTAQGCFNIFGFIVNYVDLWKHCHISYGANGVYSLQQFRNTVVHDQKVENKLENYFADKRNNFIDADPLQG